MWKHLCWSYFLTMLQVSRPETSLKRDSRAGIFLQIFHNSYFHKPYLQNTSRWLLSWYLHSNQKCYPLITLCSFFPSIFGFIIDNSNNGSLLRKSLKMTIFLLFTIIYWKINMLLRQFHLGNNLPMHIRENTDFVGQLQSHCRLPRWILKADIKTGY